MADLIIQKRLRAFILAKLKEWGIERQRIPGNFYQLLKDDLEHQIAVRICAEFDQPAPPPPPKEPAPRKPQPPTKRSLKNHPTLF